MRRPTLYERLFRKRMVRHVLSLSLLAILGVYIAWSTYPKTISFVLFGVVACTTWWLL